MGMTSQCSILTGLLTIILCTTQAVSYRFGNILHHQNTAIRSKKNNLLHKSKFHHPHLPSTINIKSNDVGKTSMESLNVLRSHRMFSADVFLSSYSPWQGNYPHEEQVMGDQVDDVDLSYLPIDFFDLPPKTEDLLRRVTHTYVMGDVRKDLPSKITVNDVLHTIDAEYRYNAVPLSIGDISLAVKERQTDDTDGKEFNAQEYAAKVLSFAAMHCLPAEVTKFLFAIKMSIGETEIGYGPAKKTLESIRLSLQSDGWKSVSFPYGLSLRMKRDFIFSKRVKYNPIPRKSLLTRKRDIAKANRFIKVAAIVKPPSRVVNTANMLSVIDKNMLAVMDEIPEPSVKSRMSLSQDWSLKGMQTFFPRQKRLWRYNMYSFLQKAKKYLYTSRIVKRPVRTLAVALTGTWLLVRILLTIRRRLTFVIP